MKANWKRSMVLLDCDLERELFLPDENDKHVLAIAILGQAQILLTDNLKDFPSRILFRHGIFPRSVDSFLSELFEEYPEIIELNIQKALELSENGNDCKLSSKKAFLKRFGMPGLAKRIAS